MLIERIHLEQIIEIEGISEKTSIDLPKRFKETDSVNVRNLIRRRSIASTFDNHDVKPDPTNMLNAHANSAFHYPFPFPC